MILTNVDVALVLGGAESVWDDMQRAFALFRPAAIYACNDIGSFWPGRLDAWVTLHPENMRGWISARERRGFEPAREIIFPPMKTRQYLHGVSPDYAYCYHDIVNRIAEYRFDPEHFSPSSGLFAAKTARDDGYRAVLCGIPMDAQGGHFLRRAQWDTNFSTLGLKDALPSLREFARSMSGTTRDLLGEPDTAWLEGGAYEERSTLITKKGPSRTARAPRRSRSLLVGPRLREPV